MSINPEQVNRELVAACRELMPILREPIHWRLLVPGERRLILRIEKAISQSASGSINGG